MSDFLIILDNGGPVERDGIHELVKGNSNGWWHQLGNTWIVNGRTAGEWRTLVKAAIVTDPDASVFVIKIDSSDWAFNGPNAEIKCRWLHDNI